MKIFLKRILLMDTLNDTEQFNDPFSHPILFIFLVWVTLVQLQYFLLYLVSIMFCEFLEAATERG